ncbi:MULTISPECIES: inorganic phosphate transporter [unclassified Thermosipho (in: thermotogales)]|uniref:inorganic phosphate transporter n=1 Tax=unclassified Thermosipho (in: thermotogales) TaxID=2676525 RepID=UPI000985227B|nr:MULTISPECIES: inorganic phosphate transporter [unclassified Thermosipho (in: thermotogales)]MBT1247088.1 phosphate permease [Thermosipho sp. 1244]OOC46859.1 phosphate permease [Thermosipho sp. 1223]
MYLLSSIIFGILLGSNDSANIFGPSVEMGILKYRKVTIIAAIFTFLGAIIGGERGIRTISTFSNIDIYSATISVISAAITMFILSKIGIPSSSSQSIVGAIIGINLLTNNLNTKLLLKLFLAWILTPIGGIIFTYLLYKTLSPLFNKIKSIQTREKIIILSTLIIGSYGAYSLGANNVANITGVFANNIGTKNATFVGGISMAIGALLSNKKVMYTISKKIMELDYFSSAVSSLGQAITVWIYSLVGIPVSVSQAIVGAVIGAGYAKGSKITNKKVIIQIFLTWIITPTFSAFISIILNYLLKISIF